MHPIGIKSETYGYITKQKHKNILDFHSLIPICNEAKDILSCTPCHDLWQVNNYGVFSFIDNLALKDMISAYCHD